MRNSPEYYMQIGYEDCGYVSPKLSSTGIYPDYIKNEVERCVKRIQSFQNKNTVTFGFMTDLHYALSENHTVRMKRTINAYKEIAKRAYINKLFLGGDYTNEACKEHKSACYRELRAIFDGVPYYAVNGNHDDGTIWDHSYIKKEENWTNYFTHQDLYAIFYNHLPNLNAQFDKNNFDALYYFVDDAVTQTRYICIDANDIPYITDEKGKLVYSGQYKFAMSQKQLDWLTNTALNTENGWDILVFTHSVSLPNEDLTWSTKHLSVFNDIVDAYNEGKSIKSIYYEEDKDFTVNIDADFSKATGKIAGVFVGDYHYDDVVHTATGIPYILTANAVMYFGSDPRYVKRYDGDKTEILFDIIVFDKTRRVFNIIRSGAGEDRIVNSK